AKARTAAMSVWAPTGADGITCAALDAGSSVSTERVTPSSVAGPAHIRASWPPPMTPTTGNPPGARTGDDTWAGYAAGPVSLPWCAMQPRPRRHPRPGCRGETAREGGPGPGRHAMAGDGQVRCHRGREL